MACLSWVPRVKFAPHCAQEKGAIGRFMGGLQNGRSALDHFGGVVDLDCLKCVRPHIRYKQMWVSLAMLGKVGRWRSDMYWRRQFHNRRLSLASEFAGRNLLRNYRYMSANNEQNSSSGRGTRCRSRRLRRISFHLGSLRSRHMAPTKHVLQRWGRQWPTQWGERWTHV